MNDSRVENAKQMVGDKNQSVLYIGWAVNREILPNLTSNARLMFVEASSRMNLGAFGCPVLADNKQLGNQLLILLNNQMLTLLTS